MAETMAVQKKPKRSYTSRNKLKMPSSLLQLSDLNDHCLIHIFKCLDTISLAKMCKVGDQFHDIITQHVIPLRTIDFTTLSNTCSVRKMFALFGKWMTRIVIHLNDIQMVYPGYTRFAEFLRMLIEHGKPGQLKCVNLTFNDWEYDRSHFTDMHLVLSNVSPYFTNVHELQFDLCQFGDAFFPTFLKAIDKRNLRVMRVNNILYINEWLSAELLSGVQKLHLHLSKYFQMDSHLLQFISSKPASLIDFQCTGARGDKIFGELSRLMPNTIERLGEIQYWPNDVNNNNNNNDGGSHGKWKYFNAFTNLKGVSLKSWTTNFSDSGEAFSILARRQIIEELQLSFGMDDGYWGNPVKTHDLKRLTRLKILHLLNVNDGQCKEFVNLLLANLPALTTCTIDGNRLKQDRIIELIKLAPNLKVLELHCKVTLFSVPFYKKLVKCRAPSDDQAAANEENRLVIYIDTDSAQKLIEELGKYKRYKPSIVMLRSI